MLSPSEFGEVGCITAPPGSGLDKGQGDERELRSSLAKVFDHPLNRTLSWIGVVVELKNKLAARPANGVG